MEFHQRWGWGPAILLVLRWEREGTRCALGLSLEVGEVQLGGQNSPVLPTGLGCTVPVEFAGVVGRLSMGRMMRWVGLGNEVGPVGDRI